MWRRARRSTSGSALPEWTSSALPSNTRKPDHQSTCETSTEQRGSRRRFLNFARVSVMEMPTPPSLGYTVTMLSCGMPFRLNDVSTPCGLSWMNCSICGASGAWVDIERSFHEDWRDQHRVESMLEWREGSSCKAAPEGRARGVLPVR